MLITTMTYHTTHQEGRSALSLALERGDVDVMKVLIEGGADVNTQNKVIMYRSLHYTWSHAHSEHVVISISVDIHVYTSSAMIHLLHV